MYTEILCKVAEVVDPTIWDFSASYFALRNRLLGIGFQMKPGRPNTEVAQKRATSPKDEQLKELVTWQNTAIALFTTNYLAFLAALLFISSIVLSTADLDILLDSKLPLPIVGGQVNVRGFYLICPWVITILHVGLLAKFESILSRGLYLHNELSKIPNARLARRFRFSIVGGIHFPFPDGASVSEVLSRLCILIFLTSLFVFPMALLLLIEWRFLGYHSIGITVCQLGALLVVCFVSW